MMLRFVINLDSSKERFESAKKRLAELNVKFERISAVDGKKLSKEETDRLTYPLTDKKAHTKFTRTLSRGEVGAFLSHRICWQKLLDSEENWALILEDDLVISDRAPQYLLSDSWIPEGVELLQLHSLRPSAKMHIRHKTISLPTGDTLIAPLTKALGAQCYFISRKAAKRALELSAVLPAPVDDFLFSQWYDMAKDFKVWRLHPTVVTQAKIPSDIGNRRKETQKAGYWTRHGVRPFVTKGVVRLKYHLFGKKFVSYYK